ncbi:ornithine carbamoyltransferase subunit F, partial [Candidatus Fermentibacterales bacterium]|nr:ornithine carbamoyltransferase subunit F [Candidatus Fermentibacterales bacterium]
APEPLHPDPVLVEAAAGLSGESGARMTITSDRDKGLSGVDVVYTDVWVSMGEEAKATERLELLDPYRVDAKLMEDTGNRECLFMHCLPAVRGQEVADEVIDGGRSVVWDQAENRKHTIKALMAATLL